MGARYSLGNLYPSGARRVSGSFLSLLLLVDKARPAFVWLVTFTPCSLVRFHSTADCNSLFCTGWEAMAEDLQ